MDGTWTLGPVGVPSVRHSAALVGNRMYVFGGEDASGKPIDGVRVLDLGTHKYSTYFRRFFSVLLFHIFVSLFCSVSASMLWFFSCLLRYVCPGVFIAAVIADMMQWIEGLSVAGVGPLPASGLATATTSGGRVALFGGSAQQNVLYTLSTGMRLCVVLLAQSLVFDSVERTPANARVVLSLPSSLFSQLVSLSYATPFQIPRPLQPLSTPPRRPKAEHKPLPPPLPPPLLTSKRHFRNSMSCLCHRVAACSEHWLGVSNLLR